MAQLMSGEWISTLETKYDVLAIESMLRDNVYFVDSEPAGIVMMRRGQKIRYSREEFELMLKELNGVYECYFRGKR